MIFVGDFVPQKTKPILPDFGSGWVVANLEGPVCADETPKALKVGVHLHSAPFQIKGKWAFALANNHLMDFGVEGMKQTFAFLSARKQTAETAWAGAGTDIGHACEPMILEESGKKIAVISCCERQFGVATEESAGVAAKGEWLYAAIAKAKSTADFVVVSCHCASEFSTAVSPQLQAFYHSLVDAGADVIHGHHSHVPQGWEEYKGRPIFYGLGNFVIDPAMWRADPNYQWCLIARVDFFGEKLTWSVTPKGCIPADVEGYLARANLGFRRPELLEALWQESSVKLYHRLYEQNLRIASVESVRLSLRDRLRKILFASGDLFRALLGRELPTTKSKFYGRVAYNFFNCESHVDMISTALGVLTGSVKDERGKLTDKLAEED